MNISNISKIAKTYGANPITKKKEYKEETKTKPSLEKVDSFVPSSKVPPKRMAAYISGEFLDDPAFSDKLDKLISELGN
jgi:hypothetical protein